MSLDNLSFLVLVTTVIRASNFLSFDAAPQETSISLRRGFETFYGSYDCRRFLHILELAEKHLQCGVHATLLEFLERFCTNVVIGEGEVAALHVAILLSDREQGSHDIAGGCTHKNHVFEGHDSNFVDLMQSIGIMISYTELIVWSGILVVCFSDYKSRYEGQNLHYDDLAVS